MKVIKHILLIVLFILPLRGLAQYKGSKFITPKGEYDIKNSAPSGALSFGYLFSHHYQVEADISYKLYENSDLKGHYILIKPTFIYKAYNAGRFSLLTGGGAIIGGQFVETKDVLAEAVFPKKMCYGAFVRLAVEYLVTSNTSVIIGYNFEYLQNPIINDCHVLSAGIRKYF